MNYLILDIETEGQNYRSRFCDPLDKRNKVVMLQLKKQGELTKVIYSGGEDLRSYDFTLDLEGIDLLVGQNFKFDMLYLWGNKSIQDWLRNGGEIYDTRTIDFLLNGQRKDIEYNLNALGKRYNHGSKVDEISELYKKPHNLTTMGIIDKIGLDEYKRYAVQDVVLTEKVFLSQQQLINAYGMKELTQTYMTYYKTIIETEYNGMYVDYADLENEMQHLDDKIQHRLSLMTDLVSDADQNWDAVGFNVDSNDHLSALCFGGILSYIEKEEIGVFKTGAKKGETKYKNVTKTIQINGLTKPTNAVPVKKAGFYKVDKDVLSAIGDHIQIVDVILDYKTRNKLHTDYEKIRKNTNPFTACLHSEINTTATVTGRLSSSNPGSQNLHPTTLGVIRSRSNTGAIVELDWCQQEIAMAAYIFKDKILTEEVLQGIDMHLHNAMMLLNKPEALIDKSERKLAKFMSFGILYGQSSWGLAHTHNISEGDANNFIDLFYNKYTKIRQCHDKLKDLISTNPLFDAEKGYWYQLLGSPTTKRYFVRTWPNKRGEMVFRFPQYANYMIQGGGADLQAYCVGKLFNTLLTNRNKYVIINNVHDSIVLDVFNEADAIEIAEDIKNKLEAYAKEYTGTELFKIEYKVGETWLATKS